MRPWPDVFCRDMPEDEEGKGAALSGVEDCSRYDDRDIILTKKVLPCHSTRYLCIRGTQRTTNNTELPYRAAATAYLPYEPQLCIHLVQQA